jgi:hypothetical protein
MASAAIYELSPCPPKSRDWSAKEAGAAFGRALRAAISLGFASADLQLEIAGRAKTLAEAFAECGEHAELMDAATVLGAQLHYHRTLKNGQLVPEAEAVLALSQAQQLFKASIVEHEQSRFSRALGMLAEAQQALAQVEAAVACARKRQLLEDLAHEWSIQVEECCMQENISKAQRHLKRGETLLKQALEEEEVLDMDALFAAMDELRCVVAHSAKCDLEQEACALAHLGVIHARVFSNRERGHELCQRALHEALSMSPRDFRKQTWFTKAELIVKEYQTRRQQEESNVWQAARKPHLEALKDELAKLKTLTDANNVTNFLRHIYKEHPLKNAEQKLLEPIEGNEKKRLTKALLHYHTDKQNKDELGEKWYVLCEEITKYLNVFFNKFK